MATVIALALVVAAVAATVSLLPTLAKIFLYGLVAAALAMKFVAEKIFEALPWIVAAIGALTVGFVGLGRQFFGAGDAKRFAEKFLPPRETERETFALTLIELMIVLREKLRSVNHAG